MNEWAGDKVADMKLKKAEDQILVGIIKLSA